MLSEAVPNSTIEPTPRRRLRRHWFWRVPLALLVVMVVWHFGYRATWSWRAIRIAGTTTDTATVAGETIRVLAYNIAHGRGLATSNWEGGSEKQQRQRLRDIAALLRDADADVVVLNEVDFNCTWSHGINQAAYIAREAGYPYVVEQRNVDVALPWFSARFGNAILSRRTILRAEVVHLPVYSMMKSIIGGRKRGVVATLDLGDDRTIRVLAVHLEHRDEPTRFVSAGLILDMCDVEVAPLVAAGDFNSTPSGQPSSQSTTEGENAMNRLLDNGQMRTGVAWSDQIAAFSFPSPAPQRRLDWVLVNEGLEILDDEILDSQLSDHRPVMATIRVP